ncbi:DUF4233 domain-containing protein [Planctomonas psychrotolerans]|uniref:DUF4233 domain-containing protein n=1 Tax=Planctomonas psychrotolerans TaxID=2528712 RepID=UPI001D0CF874|nr:DUF4233 domain-containing protein [Planctomonas psychrotolerans]
MTATAPGRARPPRSTKQTLGSIVIGFEFIVVFLAALVAFGLEVVPATVALGGGGALLALMLVTMYLLRYPVGFVLGWTVQLLVFASGLVLPAIFVVGAFFAALWAYCMIAGARIDREKAAAQSAWTTAETQEENP